MKITRRQLRQLIKEEYEVTDLSDRLSSIKTMIDYTIVDAQGKGRPYDKATWTTRLNKIIEDATFVRDNLPD
jgi:hypothetical protein